MTGLRSASPFHQAGLHPVDMGLDIAARGEQLSGFIEHANQTFQAIGSQQSSLARGLKQLPGTLRAGNQTFKGLSLDARLQQNPTTFITAKGYVPTAIFKTIPAEAREMAHGAAAAAETPSDYRRGMNGVEANFVLPAELIGHPTRSAMLLALLDGRALPMSMLASEAGVAAGTASEHLAKLTGGGLLRVRTQGRRRYYELASPQVAEALETPARHPPQTWPLDAVRVSRLPSMRASQS